MENNDYYEPKIKTLRKPFIHNELGIKIGEEVITSYRICTDDCISKAKLISFLEDKIKETDKTRKMHKMYSLSEERLSSKYYAFCEVLDFVNEGGKR